jgi:hypothetical protein
VWVPDDLMAVQAYILWEKAGKPQGADFAQAAREEIHRQLKSGMKLEARSTSSSCGVCAAVTNYFMKHKDKLLDRRGSLSVKQRFDRASHSSCWKAPFVIVPLWLLRNKVHRAHGSCSCAGD